MAHRTKTKSATFGAKTAGLHQAKNAANTTKGGHSALDIGGHIGIGTGISARRRQ